MRSFEKAGMYPQLLFEDWLKGFSSKVKCVDEVRPGANGHASKDLLTKRNHRLLEAFNLFPSRSQRKLTLARKMNLFLPHRIYQQQKS